MPAGCHARTRTGSDATAAASPNFTPTSSSPRNTSDPCSPTSLTTCETITRHICTRHHVDLAEFNGEPDHVHLLIEYPATVRLSELIGHIKGTTARVIRQLHADEINAHLWGKHFWSPSYFAASCGGAPLNILHHYIQNQERPPRG